MAVAPTSRGDRPAIAAEVLLHAPADHGAGSFFCGPGTDFQPVVEALGCANKPYARTPY